MVLAITVLSYRWHLPPELPVDFIHRPKEVSSSGSARLALGEKISINHADAQDFMALPGIGPGRAASIIAWRELHGPFVRPEDLQKVPGIGPQIFQRLADAIEVSQPHPPQPNH